MVGALGVATALVAFVAFDGVGIVQHAVHRMVLGSAKLVSSLDTTTARPGPQDTDRPGQHHARPKYAPPAPPVVAIVPVPATITLAPEPMPEPTPLLAIPELPVAPPAPASFSEHPTIATASLAPSERPATEDLLPPAPAVATPDQRLNPAEAARLFALGETLVSIGQTQDARVLFAAAAEAGSPEAHLALKALDVPARPRDVAQRTPSRR